MAEPKWVSDRTEQLLETIPNVFDYKRVLNIGARRPNFTYRDKFSIEELTLLEIWKPYVDEINKLTPELKTICGDTCQIDKIFKPNEFNLTMFLHGPEHIKRDEFESTISKIEIVTKELVILWCPWGFWEQKADGDNIYQIHKCGLYPEDFLNIGYAVRILGKKDKMNSNIFAWKYLNKKRLI